MTISAMTPASSQYPPSHTSTTTSGTPHAAVTARRASDREIGTPSPPRRAAPVAALSIRGLVDAPKAAFAGLIRGDRFKEVPRRKFRPRDIREVQLRVGRLPQQKITQALLAAGPNQEIGIRQ